MSNAYDELVQTGYVGSLKRDVLLEARRDLMYVSSILGAFGQAGTAAKADAVACAVELIDELIATGLCSLATWSRAAESGRVAVQRSRDELEAIVAESVEHEHIWEYFLVSTAAGEQWVARYDRLVDELQGPSGSGHAPP